MKSILLALATALSLSAATCESLASLSLPSTTFTTAESRPAGEFSPPTGQPLPNLPAFCRVAGVIKPSSDSDIRFELWLPSANWNGKFQGGGNGGYARFHHLPLAGGRLAPQLCHGFHRHWSSGRCPQCALGA